MCPKYQLKCYYQISCKFYYVQHLRDQWQPGKIPGSWTKVFSRLQLDAEFDREIFDLCKVYLFGLFAVGRMDFDNIHTVPLHCSAISAHLAAAADSCKEQI